MKYLRLFVVFSSFVFLINCSGSSSSDSDSDSGTVSSDALSSLTNIPDLNVDSMDANSATTNSSLSSLVKAASTRPSDRSYSRTACEVRSAVEEIKSQVKGFRSERCIDKAFESAGLIAVGNGAFNYYEVIIDESMFADELEDELEEGGFDPDDLGEETAYVRVGLVSDQLSVMLCEIDDGEAVEIAMGFNVQWGAGTINFNADKASSVITNEMDFSWRSGASGSEWGTWRSTGYALFDSQEGCGVHESTGTYKGDVAGNMFSLEDLTTLGLAASDNVCWKQVDNYETAVWPTDFVEAADSNGMCTFTDGSTDNTECFFYDLTDAGALDYMVLGDTSASPYVDAVTAKSSFLDFNEPTFTFQETWDCTAPNGFTRVVVAEHPDLLVSLSACIALEVEAEGSRSTESCEDKEQQDHAEGETGQEFSGEGEGQGQEQGP